MKLLLAGLAEFGGRVARRQRIDRHARAPQIRSHAACHGRERALGRDIGHQVGPGHVVHDRAHLDDATSALRHHGAGGTLRDVEAGVEVGVDHPLPLVGLQLQEGLADDHCCVIDQHVDAAEALLGLVESRVHGAAVRHIKSQREHVRAGGAQGLGTLVHPLAAIGQHQVRARCGESRREARCNATRRTGHEDHAVAQAEQLAGFQVLEHSPLLLAWA